MLPSDHTDVRKDPAEPKCIWDHLCQHRSSWQPLQAESDGGTSRAAGQDAQRRGEGEDAGTTIVSVTLPGGPRNTSANPGTQSARAGCTAAGFNIYTKRALLCLTQCTPGESCKSKDPVEATDATATAKLASPCTELAECVTMSLCTSGQARQHVRVLFPRRQEQVSASEHGSGKEGPKHGEVS